MKKLAYLLATICSIAFALSSLAHAQDIVNQEDAVLNGKGPVATVQASLLDYTQNEDYTGNVSLPIPLVSLGGASVQLKYYSQGVATKVRTENQYAPSGEVGLGWQLLYGSISGEINGSADTSDDVYYYNGPDGSYQLQEGADGVFRIPNYKPWKIQRVMDGNIIAGWIVTKEDGTILRYGNYDKSSGQFLVQYSPTNATRFFLGLNGMVANPDPSQYGNLQYIPYQWDLSNVQDIKGDQTTLNYQQVDLPLVSNGISSANNGWEYTCESHLSQILDNKGQEVDFGYLPMSSPEYYDNYASYDQNLVDTLYLDSIKIHGNTLSNRQLYKQIVFSYDTSDVSGLGIVKRYLTGFTIEDANGNSLPSYNFEYYGLNGIPTGYNPGALRSASDPQGGETIFTYSSQSLTNFPLSLSNPVGSIDYWDYLYDGNTLRCVPKSDGLAGKSFLCVSSYIDSNHDSVHVYRRGPNGWYLDTSVQPAIVFRAATGADYIVFENPGGGGACAKLTPNGWDTCDVASLIQQKTGFNANDFQVVGTGANYFVVKYNQSGPNGSNGLYTYNVCIVMLTPIGLKAYPLPDNYLDGGVDYLMHAYCGEDYMVLKSMSANALQVFSHFTFLNSNSGWETLINQGDSELGENEVPDPYNVSIGRDFVILRNQTSSTSGWSTIKVYRHAGNQVDSVREFGYVPDYYTNAFAAGDDYFAFGIGYTTPAVAIETWDGTKFDSTSVTLSNALDLSLEPFGNKLIISWSEEDANYQYIGKLGYMVLSPATHSWGPLILIDSTSYDKNNEWRSYGVGINQNSFAELWYQKQVNPSSVTHAYLRIYQFRDREVACSLTNEIPIRWQVAAGDTIDEDPSLWVMQPGQDFIALSRPGVSGAYYFPPDSVDTYTFVQAPDGSLQFTGNPTVPVLSQTTVEDGRDHSATYDYAFTSGVLNQYLTPEFENVTETLPGANGSISTSYYVHKDSTANGINYKFLEGMPYQVVDYNSSGSQVKSVENTWTTVGVDPANGIYNQELLSKTTSLDGVTNTTSYSYDGAAGAYMLNQETETNSDSVERITSFKRPLDYAVGSLGGDTMSDALYQMANTYNDINPIIERWVISDSNNIQNVMSGDLTTYEISGSAQVLPYQSFKLFSPGPIPVAQFTPSTDTYNGPNGWIFSFDSAYLTAENFNSYNEYGDPLETTDANRISTSYEYGYGGSNLMGVVKNTGGGPYIFDDFNDGHIRDNDPFSWETSSGWTDSAQTLKSDYGSFAQPPGIQSQSFTADVRIRILNYATSTDWAGIVFGNQTNTPFGSGYLVFIRGNGNVSFFDGTPDTTISEVSAGATYGQWHRLTVSVNGANVQIFVDGKLEINKTLSSAPSSGYVTLYDYGTEVQFDDFRCYPYGGLAYSYGYDPVTLELTNKNGPNNIPTYYTYDSFQRLSTVQNDQNEVVKSLRYYLAGSSISYGNPNWTTTTLYRDATDSTTATKYFDGLGRDIQTITQDGAEPIVSAIKFDQMNRDSLNYKPFLSTTGSGYVTGYLVDYYDEGYYNTYVYDDSSDSYPYLTNLYYPDPLGRLEDMVPPGAPWQSRPIQYSYGTNATGDINGYSAGTLYKTAITSENLVKKLEYKDKFGNLVETEADSGGLDLKTSFTYDVLGDLTQSTSPAGYATDYSYNTLGELTQKTSPDAGTTQYLYDNNGNLRFVKDANHTGSTNNTSPFSGSIYGTSSATQNLPMTMPGTVEIDLYNEFGAYEDDTIFVKVETTDGTTLLSFYCDLDQGSNTEYIYLPKGTYVCHFTSTADPNDQGAEFDYDAACYSNYEFAYRKYDALNRLTEEEMYSGSTASGDFAQSNASSESFPSGPYGADYGLKIFRRNFFYDTPSPDANASGQTNIKGRLSYTESYDVNGNLVERTSYSYDDMERVEWMVESGPTAYSKVMNYSYDLQGDVTSKSYNDYAPGMGELFGSFSWDYSYDEAGRLNSVGTEDAMSGIYTEGNFQYFASGKLQQLVLGYEDPTVATVNYHYNQRDWLTSDSTTYFWEHIGYDNISEVGSLFGATPQYNGNISWDSYYMNGLTYTDPVTNQSTSTVGYAFGYDNANRLTGAGFGYSPSPNNWAWSGPYNMTISYYNDGNPRNLQRNGSDGSQIDNLNYNYRPNTDIDTLITNTAGSGSIYTYDPDGNMISDSKNNIGFVLYDIYNEPEALYKTDGSVIQYRYDPNGSRVEKQIGSTYNYYIRGKDGNTDVVVLDPEGNGEVFNTIANGNKIGQVVWDNNSYSMIHYYYLEDHLGDVRMILDQSGNPQVWNDYYPFGEMMPGRSQFNAGPDPRYGYVSKEYDIETGSLHFGHRDYDPWGLMFHSVDPFADKYPWQSPYSYALDNPEVLVDVNGDSAGSSQQVSQQQTLTLAHLSQVPEIVKSAPLRIAAATDIKEMQLEVVSEAVARVVEKISKAIGLSEEVGGTLGFAAGNLATPSELGKKDLERPQTKKSSVNPQNPNSPDATKVAPKQLQYDPITGTYHPVNQ